MGHGERQVQRRGQRKCDAARIPDRALTHRRRSAAPHASSLLSAPSNATAGFPGCCRCCSLALDWSHRSRCHPCRSLGCTARAAAAAGQAGRLVAAAAPCAPLPLLMLPSLLLRVVHVVVVVGVGRLGTAAAAAQRVAPQRVVVVVADLHHLGGIGLVLVILHLLLQSERCIRLDPGGAQLGYREMGGAEGAQCGPRREEDRHWRPLSRLDSSAPFGGLLVRQQAAVRYQGERLWRRQAEA